MERLINVTDSSGKRNLVFSNVYIACVTEYYSINNLETREITDEKFKARAFATLSAL
jgi:hypothetical protein